MDVMNRILAVDDSNVNLRIVEKLLGDSYAIKCAQSGEEAIRVAPLFRPNLVLLDVVMPGLNGTQTCRMLLAKPELRGIKIVMFSVRVAVHDRLAGYEAGAVDYIGKPFDSQEIQAKVRAWMRMVYKETIGDIANRHQPSSNSTKSVATMLDRACVDGLMEKNKKNWMSDLTDESDCMRT